VIVFLVLWKIILKDRECFALPSLMNLGNSFWNEDMQTALPVSMPFGPDSAWAVAYFDSKAVPRAYQPK